MKIRVNEQMGKSRTSDKGHSCKSVAFRMKMETINEVDRGDVEIYIYGYMQKLLRIKHCNTLCH